MILAGLYYLFMPTDAIANDAFQGIVENIVLEFFGIPDIGAIFSAISSRPRNFFVGRMSAGLSVNKKA